MKHPVANLIWHFLNIFYINTFSRAYISLPVSLNSSLSTEKKQNSKKMWDRELDNLTLRNVEKLNKLRNFKFCDTLTNLDMSLIVDIHFTVYNRYTRYLIKTLFNLLSCFYSILFQSSRNKSAPPESIQVIIETLYTIQE